jgi:hypothetical protein
MRAFSQHTPERRQVACPIRVDHRQIIGRRHLDQTQFRPEGVFGDKLRIEADTVGVSQPLAG